MNEPMRFSTEWPIALLTDVADVIDPHPTHRAPQEDQNGIPFAGIGDLDENGNLDYSKVRKVPSEVFADHQAKYRITSNTIGFGRVASIGKVIDFKGFVRPVTISPTLAIIEPKDINKKFLLNVLRSEKVKTQIGLLTTGSTRSSLGIELLRTLEVIVPPLPEQQKIASILTAVDEVIASTTAQINKLKDLKTGMMQELLTKGIGRAGHPHTEFKDSPVGRIPKSWEVVKTGQVTKSIVPGRNKPKQLDGDIPWITISDIDEVYISKSKSNFGVSRIVLAEASGKTVPKDAVVMTVVGEFGISAVAACELVLNQQLHAFVCSVKIFPMYLCFILRFQKAQLEKLATQTTIAYMNKENTESLLIPLPSIDEQKKITEAVLSVENSIVKKTSRLNALYASKKALMQDLLTGKVRVKVNSQ